MEPSPNSTQWWKADDHEAAARALAMINAINTSQVAWHADNLRHTRMYENRDYFGTEIRSVRELLEFLLTGMNSEPTPV